MTPAPFGSARDERGSITPAARRVLGVTTLVALCVSALVTATVVGAMRLPKAAAMTAPRATAVPTAPAPPAPVPAADRADATLRREGHTQVAGGVLYLPPSFASADGAYDLLMHFHGNSELVKESVASSGLPVVLYVLSLGIGSGPYEVKFQHEAVLENLLARLDDALRGRGLRQPRLRRLALASWSAGYGAVGRILELPRWGQRVDAVLVLDGIHCAYKDRRTRELDRPRLGPFLRLAREAAASRRLFSLTHSEISAGTYGSTAEVADALLDEVGGRREPVDAARDSPAQVTLRASIGVVPKKSRRWLEAKSAARVGELRVRGFSGETPEHHMAHLMQMSVTVLPELAQRWR